MSFSCKKVDYYFFRRQAAQIANFETREFNWIKVKNDLEKRSQELTERAERSERYVKQKLSMAIDESFSRMVGKKGEHDYVSKMVCTLIL